MTTIVKLINSKNCHLHSSTEQSDRGQSCRECNNFTQRHL